MAGCTELSRGQRARIPDEIAGAACAVSIEVQGMAAQDLLVFCLLVDEKESILGGDQVVFADRSPSRCGSVRGEGTGPARFAVDLSRAPANAARLVFAFGVTEAARARGMDASHIRSAVFTLRHRGADAFQYRLSSSDLGRETAITLVELYRKDGWRVTATGSGYLGGIPSMISRYRGNPLGIADPQRQPPPDRAPDRRPNPNPSPAPPPGRGATRAALPRAWARRTEPTVPGCLVPAIGLVVVKHAEGLSTGTGFMIGPGGYFLTCAHVVDGHSSVAIALDGVEELRPATVARIDKEGDLALLHLDDRNGVSDWLLLADADFKPMLGDNLGLLGYPLGGDLGISLTYSQGVINSLRKVNDIPVLQVDTGAAPGSSGGPVFRRSDGRVVGVLTSGLPRLQGSMLVNFAVDIRRVWQLGWVS